MPGRTRPADFLLPLALLAFVGFWFHALTTPVPLPPPAPTGVRIEIAPTVLPEAPAAYERGTAQYPLIVDLADTEKTRDRDKREAAWHQEAAEDNRRISLVAGLLAAIGFIQFLAMIVQVYWMKRWVQPEIGAPGSARK